MAADGAWPAAAEVPVSMPADVLAALEADEVIDVEAGFYRFHGLDAERNGRVRAPRSAVELAPRPPNATSTAGSYRPTTTTPTGWTTRSTSRWSSGACPLERPLVTGARPTGWLAGWSHRLDDQRTSEPSRAETSPLGSSRLNLPRARPGARPRVREGSVSRRQDRPTSDAATTTPIGPSIGGGTGSAGSATSARARIGRPTR